MTVLRTSLHLFCVFIDVVRTNSTQEADVVVAMVAGHLFMCRWVWSLQECVCVCVCVSECECECM